MNNNVYSSSWIQFISTVFYAFLYIFLSRIELEIWFQLFKHTTIFCFCLILFPPPPLPTLRCDSSRSSQQRHPHLCPPFSHLLPTLNSPLTSHFLILTCALSILLFPHLHSPLFSNSLTRTWSLYSLTLISVSIFFLNPHS